MMEYKGYVGCSLVNEETGLIFGEVMGLRDVITYQGRTADEARKSFDESIELYFNTCGEEGIDPDKPYSGKLLVRTKSSVHRALAFLARSRGMSLNTLADRILTRAVRKASISFSASISRTSGSTKGPKATTSTKRLAKTAPEDRPRKRKKATG